MPNRRSRNRWQGTRGTAARKQEQRGKVRMCTRRRTHRCSPRHSQGPRCRRRGCFPPLSQIRRSARLRRRGLQRRRDPSRNRRQSEMPPTRLSHLSQSRLGSHSPRSIPATLHRSWTARCRRRCLHGWKRARRSRCQKLRMVTRSPRPGAASDRAVASGKLPISASLEQQGRPRGPGKVTFALGQRRQHFLFFPRTLFDAHQVLPGHRPRKGDRS